MINRTNTRRLAIALVLGGALLVSYPAVSGGALWDVGAACGYVCLILFVCLYVFPVRADGLPHSRLLGLSQHKTIGWCVLAAAGAHVAVVLLAEPQTGRYLLPSAPLFMWCGIAALLCAVASVITGLSARSHMRHAHVPASAAAAASTTTASPSEGMAATSRPPGPPSRGAQSAADAARSRATLHVVLAAMLMATICAHVIGSAQLLSGAVKTGVGLFLLSMPLGWYALRQRPACATARRVSHVVAVVLIAALPAATSKQHLLEPVTGPGPIELNFPHDSHTSVNCVMCHHNYVDHTGTTACVECHRDARRQMSAEATFHTLCRDCHTQLASNGSHEHGPTRSCSACHQGMRSSNL